MAPDTENKKVELTAEEAAYFAERAETTKFDNDGNAVINNRAARRKRPATDPKFTKATHSLKLARATSKKEYRKTH
jgi:hypothetical protein